MVAWSWDDNRFSRTFRTVLNVWLNTIADQGIGLVLDRETQLDLPSSDVLSGFEQV
jgi:hypothetical protein